MNNPRFFVHISGATVDDMVEQAARHGTPLQARGYLTPLGRGIYGSVEVIPHATEEEAKES